MIAIDRQQVIEAAATAIHDAACTFHSDRGISMGHYPIEMHAAQDAALVLPVIVAAVLKPIREQVAEWREFMRDPDLTGYERSAMRMCASEMERLLDQIKAATKGGE